MQGIVYKPDKTKSIENFVDALFASEWNTEWIDEPSSVMSRTGYVIMYANFPIIWCSKLQTEISLSTRENEYVVLSQLLRDVKPLIGMLKVVTATIKTDEIIPIVHCTIFEENRGCIDLVETPKIRLGPKCIAIKDHHFRSHVRDKTISI